MKKFFALLLMLAVIFSETACGSKTIEEATVPQQAEQSQESPEAQSPEAATDPEPEPFVMPSPIVYTGTGDSVVELKPFDGLCVFHITGNAKNEHFSVISYDQDSNELDFLVNTIKPYDGVVMNWYNDAAFLEVKSSGAWVISVESIYSIPMLLTGESMSGYGDAVLASDQLAKTAEIVGNEEGGHFAIWGYGYESNLWVNTVDKYEGTVLLKDEVAIIEVDADSDWTISLK